VSARAARSRHRRGVTLIELMITLVLLSIVAGGMMQIIV
jgi:prepilin-type N-terminal cleavage/methylation domain-containing protein